MQGRRVWGDRIRDERVARGWTQAQLAERAQCSRALIARLEGGSRTTRDVYKALLCNVFGLPVAEVFPIDDGVVDPASPVDLREHNPPRRRQRQVA